MAFVIGNCTVCGYHTRLPEFGKTWTCERCGANFTVTTGTKVSGVPADPMPDHWLENFRALITRDGDCDHPPHPAEMMAMEATGLIVWYDYYWCVTFAGYEAILNEIDRLRKLVG